MLHDSRQSRISHIPNVYSTVPSYLWRIKYRAEIPHTIRATSRPREHHGEHWKMLPAVSMLCAGVRTGIHSVFQTAVLGGNCGFQPHRPHHKDNTISALTNSKRLLYSLTMMNDTQTVPSMTCKECQVDCQRFGKHRNGLRRFRCPNCKRTYTETHKRMLGGIFPKPRSRWLSNSCLKAIPSAAQSALPT